MKRKVTLVETPEGVYYRSHVWNERGYSTKTFASVAEANNWVPTMRVKNNTK